MDGKGGGENEVFEQGAGAPLVPPPVRSGLQPVLQGVGPEGGPKSSQQLEARMRNARNTLKARRGRGIGAAGRGKYEKGD